MSERYPGSPERSSVLHGLAALLVVGVLGLNLGDSVYGLYGIFWLFVGGVATVPVALGVVLYGGTSADTVRALLESGLALVVGAVLLYAIFGCVFGCPG